MTLVGWFALLGGVGIFLFGMTVMSSGLKNACGENLQGILEKATKNRIMGVLLGCGMTMLIQSSSATAAMVIGFANAGMMNLMQSIGVIMGANIGTTITAQITAFDLAAYAPFILFLGAIMYLFVKKNIVKHVGEIIMGFGMLFVGISIMKEALAPLSESPQFVQLMTAMENPVLALIFGIAFTALLQSSSSSTVIFQAFAMQGLLGFDAAVYMVIGSAIGAVTPNLLAGLTVNREGKRAAILNLIFNVFRSAVIIALINIFPPILMFIRNLSPDDVGRQIANLNTIFAIVGVIISIPLAQWFVRIAEKMIPILPQENERLEERQLKYITALDRVPPRVAVDQAHREVTRMGRLAATNLRTALECFFDYDEEKAADVRGREESVDILNDEISAAMARLRTLDLSEEGIRRVSMMSIAVTDIERLSDHAENVIDDIDRLHNRHAEMSEVALAELRQMADDTIESVDLAIDIFEKEDYSKIDQIEALEQKIDDQQDQLVNNHIDRLMHESCDPLAGVIFTDLVTDLERCSDHAINVAYALKEKPTRSVHNTMQLGNYDW